MSEESQELRQYEIRCAEQQNLIELLEKEVKRLNISLRQAQAHNQRLTAMLLGQPPFPESSKQSASDTKKEDEENKEPNATPNTAENASSEDNDSCKGQDDSEEPFDFDKYPFPEDNSSEFKSYKEQIAYECQEFLKKYTFPAFYNEISKDIIGQEDGLKKMLAVIYNYIHTLALGERPEKCTAVILTAPSGNGKSALYKSLSTFLKTAIPCLVCSRKDASRLVPSGYRGQTVNSVLADFGPNEKHRNEQKFGILWLDEFDKIRFNNDGGPQVENQLLTYMDGITEHYGDVTFDTQYLFWIASGSFNETRQKKKQQTAKIIGFVGSEKNYDAFDVITREDMLQTFSHETIGRFTLIVSFNRLSEEAVTCVIIKMLEDIYKDLHLDTLISKEYIDALVKEANSEFGCRDLYNTLYETCLKAYIEILQGGVYSIDDNPTVIIDGPNDYIIIDEDIADQIRYDDNNGGKYM
ncbi:MAG: AAA family ATPase [Lachnospiraceae bacterium]|nr:AAA family ATPase [Lachnospiraceae bacterium]